jgi:hypothetical protein
MENVPKVHVSAVKTHWKHIKILAKLCISCRIQGSCVFEYIYVIFNKSTCFYSENTVKTNENTSKIVHFM